MPRSVLYDNDRCLVAKIMPDGTGNRTQRFSAMLSHYVIGDRYGRPGKVTTKARSKVWLATGVVTSWCRCHALPPGMRSTSIWKNNVANGRRTSCASHKISIGERLEADLAAMHYLARRPFLKPVICKVVGDVDIHGALSQQ